MADWAAARDLALYVPPGASSFEGWVALDRHDPAARQRVLTELASAARRVLTLADETLPTLAPAAQEALMAEISLLRQILAQDVTEQEQPGAPPEAAIKVGTAPDQIPSATGLNAQGLSLKTRRMAMDGRTA